MSPGRALRGHVAARCIVLSGMKRRISQMSVFVGVCPLVMTMTPESEIQAKLFTDTGE